MKQAIIQFVFLISSGVLSMLILDHTEININHTLLKVIIYICIVSVYLICTCMYKKKKEKLV
ncbi:hypothetical protein KTC96_22760 (plasmid) [Clostridium estertheticum]|uniref:hypothetical protein n=1 Tax=Clostridium estertheticum TaxID=238834 RepID=UPI001C7CE2EC|nr:hypothetical protein [Clostridium estertheticum]MBX4260381.1 hypothetical protein [Clostridium estertheticum]WLC73037.1 hypothetical protein KTC96_22760 [Clostridium estertheticum]